jgi:pyrroline-5-carboxylate reductase
MNRKIGIIGYGNMGSAIAERIKAKYKIFVFDKDKNKIINLKGIEVANSNIDLVEKADVVILAVKPQDFDIVLEKIKDYIKEKLIVSIAAGISTDYIEKYLGEVRVVRVMPNLPAKVGEGMSCLWKGKYATNSDLDFAEELFRHLGQTLRIEENFMNIVTAISGSGPGYFYALIQNKTSKEWESYGEKVFMPSLCASAEKRGLAHEQAEILASATTSGSIALLQMTGLSPKELCNQVTSTGGTTEAGLKELKNDINNLDKAVEAALKRAEELSRG